MAFAVLCFTGSVQAGQVTLTWDPVPGAAGYKVDYGTASRAYSASMDSGKATTTTVGGLADGTRYYFVVKAYSSTATSGPSNEVSAVVTASPTAPAPSFTVNGTSASSLSVGQGQTINLADTSTGTVTSRLWKLGDGTTAPSPTVIKSYSTAGTKTVELTVTGAGVTKTASKTVNVTTSGSTSSGATGTTTSSPTSTSGNGGSGDYPLQFGEITIDHAWQRVNFQRAFGDPIVIARPLSGNGSDPAVVRVKGVDAQGFWIRVQEWDYLDGSHTKETVSYLVIERGRHQLPNGAWMEAGRLVTSATGSFVTQSFSKPFSKIPVVLATVASANETDAVTSRVRNVGPQSFQIGMQEQEANNQQHLAESIHYVGWEPSVGSINGMKYEVGIMPSRLTEKPQTLRYGTAYSQPPLFLADMQTADGMDTADLRWRDRNNASVEVWVSEETSRDAETGHGGAESVGFLLAR